MRGDLRCVFMEWVGDCPRCDFQQPGAVEVKPGMKKRLREHGSPQPFLRDRAILTQFSSQPLIGEVNRWAAFVMKPGLK
jgi:hypothetical protein